ncbi:hypothetical protein OsI_09365 [Oryza sativa Indica Group]|uniref:EGF-like calcium-binding domain-containing protein n=1 Tax=Oryza sativa subsp. indica TaxID=39946 RepID=B8AEG2_ORYSI|nr:hypothetical protein OsI_09365 [Oryza sativa Indica Group]
MATTTLCLQGAALVVLIVCLAPVAPAWAQQPAGCPDKCGNTSIPYPFGIGSRCARDFNFRLVCNHAYSPPRLFVSEVELVSLSLDGEARALINARNYCSDGTTYISYNALRRDSQGQLPLSDVSFGRSTAYRFSAARNRFVVLGCPVLGYLVDAEEYYVSGCISMCRKSQAGDDHLSSRCTGERGCCQNTIPRPLNFYKPYILSLNKSAEENRVEPIYHRLNSTACNYVFLVEDKWIDTTYSYRAYFNRTDDFDVPVVLDWAIRNVRNCRVAKRNATKYACRSEWSECFDASDGVGYRCRCSNGYQGNPYLDGGCTDIDECQDKEKYGCYGDCTNTIGGYTCICPRGTIGNVHEKNGCRPKDKFTFALKAVTGVGLGVFMSVFMAFWLHLGLQKRKLIRTRQKFFEQNGGIFLQQQMRSYGGAGGGVGGFKIFSTEELKNATNNFAVDRILAVKVGRHQELLDSQVRNELSDEMLQEITHLLMRCLSMIGEERPAMKEVAERLESLRRYQQHPWAKAEGNEEEIQSLLGMEQNNANYQLRQQDVLGLEEGNAYTFSL